MLTTSLYTYYKTKSKPFEFYFFIIFVDVWDEGKLPLMRTALVHLFILTN